MSENINLETVQETMLISLWGRAKFSRLYPELLDDPEAVKIIEKVDYDFSRVEQGFDEYGGIAYWQQRRADVFWAGQSCETDIEMV